MLKDEKCNRVDKLYRELIGCLMYGTLTTRSNLCTAVHYFSQFQCCPTDQDWYHLKRVLRYVHGTLDIGLHFEGNENLPAIEAYSDTDWGNNAIDRRSLTGYVFKVYGSTVSWSTKKQTTFI